MAIPCHKATFYHHYNICIHSTITSCLLDDDNSVGSQPFIPLRLITYLNEVVSNTNGEVWYCAGLGTRLVYISNRQSVEWVLIADTSYPIRATIGLYNLKTPSFDSNVSMIKEVNLMYTIVQRQVAAWSATNCIS